MELWNNIKLLTSNFTRYHKRPRYLRYGVPILLIGLAVCIKLFFFNILGADTPFLFMTFIVLISSLYGGLGPGIMTTILGSIFIDFLFLLPSNSLLGTENIIRVLIYFTEGILISSIIEAKQQTDKQKDDFIEFAAHEIKTPLTSINAYAGLLVKKTSPEITKYAENIIYQVTIISQHLSDLMNIATIESGRLVYHNVEFKIYDLVQTIMDSQKISSSHEIIFTGNTERIICADKTKIGEVINNLISNAIKYSPRSKQVKIHIKNVIGGIELSVQDFGIGISKKVQNKIFDKFIRDDKAVKSGIKGLGVGLYISSQIVKKYGGKLWLKSKPDKGSTFYLFLKTK